jgi:transcriptional regulator with XRE-family HTH domain
LYPAIQYGRASLARNLIARRRKAGWSVSQLARKAKVSVATIQKLEAGTRVSAVSAVDKIDRALRAINA